MLRATLRIGVRVRLQLVETGTAHASVRTARARRMGVVGFVDCIGRPGAQWGELVIEGTWRGRSRTLVGVELLFEALGVFEALAFAGESVLKSIMLRSPMGLRGSQRNSE